MWYEQHTKSTISGDGVPVGRPGATQIAPVQAPGRVVTRTALASAFMMAVPGPFRRRSLPDPNG